MTSVDSNFNFVCGRPHGAGPPPLVHMRPPEPAPSPNRVDVINGWPLIHLIFNQISSNNMIGYNNQISKSLPYNAPTLLHNRNMHHTKPPEVDHAWPAYIVQRGPFLVRMVFSNEKAW